MAFNHNSYHIGWICALPIEMAAAKCMLDESHPDLDQPRTDTNSYALGSVASHNVVIACLPSGIYGTTSAAVVAKQMMTTFPSLSFGLMVGIGGGVPAVSRPSPDIRLGDVVIGIPSGSFGGVVAYDYGKTLENGTFLPTGSLNHPPTSLLTAVSNLRSTYLVGKGQLGEILDKAIAQYPQFQCPGPDHDILHDTCTDPDIPVDSAPVVSRPQRSSTTPQLHYGTIASGNRLIKHGKTRDQLAVQHDIYCFEMEAAGIMDLDYFPVLAIRGISDYADEFKAKEWQPFAAIGAAAYAKELLGITPKSHAEKAESIAPSTETSSTLQSSSSLPPGFVNQVFPVEKNFVGSLTTDTLFPRQNFHALPKSPAPGQLAIIHQSIPHSIRLDAPGYTSLFSGGSSKGQNASDTDDTITVDRSSSCTLNNSSDWFEAMSKQRKARQWIERQMGRSNEKIYLIVGFRSMWHRDIDITLTADNSDNSSIQSCIGEAVYAVQYRLLKFKWYRRKDIDSASLQKGNCWQSLYTDRGDDDDEDADEAEDYLEVTLDDDVTEASTAGN
ncbi:nucleoside phosphorylase domain-containing protein [Penicillium angulare]|uniref:nucleoside phosphorylase domain-containing protein n=1 Tax=Penicillium angulare TaxID=116970 RepID=UPI0025411505|nr:nucleoside phosphorylase domain-containing protein [Penicillium angulare]KAJ5281476.1 nucleoside phosphorylase domain-containing protein [Penicillium angulare]